MEKVINFKVLMQYIISYLKNDDEMSLVMLERYRKKQLLD